MAPTAAIFHALSPDGSPVPLATITQVHGALLGHRLREFLASKPQSASAGPWLSVCLDHWLEFCSSQVPLDAQHFTRRAMEHHVSAHSAASAQLAAKTSLGQSKGPANESHRWSAEDRYEESHLYVDGIPDDRVADIEDFKFFLYRKVYSTPFVQAIDVDTRSMQYGEITFSRFHKQVLTHLQIEHGSKF